MPRRAYLLFFSPLRLFLSTQPAARELAAQLKSLRPTLPKGATVVFLSDTSPHDAAFLTFLTRTVYEDPTLRVLCRPHIPTIAAEAIFYFNSGRVHLYTVSLHYNEQSSWTDHLRCVKAQPSARISSSRP